MPLKSMSEKGLDWIKLLVKMLIKVQPLPPLKNLMRKSLISQKNFGIPAPNNVKLYVLKIVLM